MKVKHGLALLILPLLLAGCELIGSLDPFEKKAEFGGNGSGDGKFNRFRDVATAPDGTTYVLDYLDEDQYVNPADYVIHSFSKDGAFIKKVTVSGFSLEAGQDLFEDSSQFGSRMCFGSDGKLYLLADVGESLLPSATTYAQLFKVDPATGIVEKQWKPDITENASFHVSVAPGASGSIYLFGCRAINDEDAPAEIFSYSSAGAVSTVSPSWGNEMLTRFIENVAGDGKGNFYAIIGNVVYALDDKTGDEDSQFMGDPEFFDVKFDDYEYNQYDGQGAIDLAVDSSGSIFVLCEYTHSDPANGDPVDIVLYKLDKDLDVESYIVNPLDIGSWTDIRSEPDGTILLCAKDGSIKRVDTTLF